MHRTILLCFLVSFSFCVIAQSDDENKPVINLLYIPIKETYLITAVSLNQFAQLETMVSPLVYKGIGVGVHFGLQRRKNERITSFNTYLSKAKLYNNIQPKQYLAELSYVNVNIATCYKIDKIQSKKINYYIGWQLAQQSDYRLNNQLQNASLSYNLSISLSPVLRVEKWLSIQENQQRKLFKKERSMRLSYQLAVPFIAGVSRPPFNAIRQLHDGSGNAYDNSVMQETISNLHLYTLNHFFALNSLLSFEYFLKNKTRIAIEYLWNYENFNVKNSAYKTSLTGIQLSLHTSLTAQ